jgi:hypothetical protein
MVAESFPAANLRALDIPLPLPAPSGKTIQNRLWFICAIDRVGTSNDPSVRKAYLATVTSANRQIC